MQPGVYDEQGNPANDVESGNDAAAPKPGKVLKSGRKMASQLVNKSGGMVPIMFLSSVVVLVKTAMSLSQGCVEGGGAVMGHGASAAADFSSAFGAAMGGSSSSSSSISGALNGAIGAATGGGAAFTMCSTIVGTYIKLALSVAVISIVACIVFLFLQRSDSISDTQKLTPMIRKIFAISMFVMWCVGTGIITFKAYPTTSNIYFAAWAAWAASTVILSENVGGEEKGEMLKGKSSANIFLMFMSIVEVLASSLLCSQMGFCVSYFAYAVSAGVISLVCALALLFAPLPGNVPRYIAMFLTVWWIAGAGVTTFMGPFTLTGNGYFSVWACLGASLMLLQQTRSDELQGTEAEVTE